MTSVVKYKRAEDCPDAATHADQPSGYAAASNWADEMMKTHVQRRCPTCGFWTIWEPK